MRVCAEQTAIYGLRQQLTIASDFIDSANVSNEALLRPLRAEIAGLAAEVAAREQDVAAARAETAWAKDEQRANGPPMCLSPPSARTGT